MHAQRPCIGLIPDVDLARNRGVDYRRHTVYAELCDRVHEAGGLPLLLPYPPDDEVLAAQLDLIDGLLLIGGDADVDPRHYGEPPHPQLGTLKPDRFEFERRAVLRGAASGLPLLGICLGLQVLNVVRGGSLWQHLPAQRPSELAHVQQHNRKLPAHAVRIPDGSLLARLCGAGDLEVNSTHHQGVRALGRGLQASAVAPDGLVEALEDPAHPFLLAVQWHPEAMDQVAEAHRHRAVFVGLVDAARRYRGAREAAPRPVDRA